MATRKHIGKNPLFPWERIGVRASLILACICTLAVAAAVTPRPARAETSFAPLRSYVGEGEWASYPLDLAAGTTYEITLQPSKDDADLYLFRGDELLSRSLALGTAVDRVRWRADGDGEVTAWVCSYGSGTAFTLAVRAVADAPGKRVGLQVGHYRNWEAPYPYNVNSGASGGGKSEAEVNLAIAQATAAILRADGYVVDILPTALPQGYRADAVVAIHADGSSDPSRRGFFTDRPAKSPVAAAEARLSRLIDQEYAAATGLNYVYRSTVDSRYYYGYYKVTPDTPMVLIETGFLTSPADRQVIVAQPEVSARGIADGIERFLEE